jgi:hypothetical protein
VRAIPAVLLLLVIAAAVAVLVRSREQPAPHAVDAPVAAPAADAPEPIAPAAGERSSLDGPRGVITGHVVDPDRQPIAGARIELAIEGAADPQAATDTARDGRFTLLGVPLQLVAIRIAAPGFATAQLGDLHPESMPHQPLDVGTLELQRATLYHGEVRALGRGLAGAEITLLPELGAPGAAVPLVQRTLTDVDGAFVFGEGPLPPCYVVVHADGHRNLRPLRVTSLQQSLQFDLEPLPHVTGRVLRGSDGSPAAEARIWLWPLTDVAPDAVLGVRPDAEPGLAAAVGADGRFDLVLPDESQFALQIECDEHVATVLGPFPTDRSHGPLSVVLPAGIAVHGNVTWHGEPVGASATLWADHDQRQPRTMAAVAADGALRLPPTPPGRWLLRVDAEHGARFERWLDLVAPGPLAIDIRVPEGTRLVGSVQGARPPSAVVVCTHASGALRRGLVHPDGGFVVEALFPGRWRARVQGNSGDWQSAATAFLGDLIDDPGFPIGDAAQQRLDLPSPALLFGRVRGQLPIECAGARVELVPGDERQRRVPPGLLQTVVREDGAFELDPVLPGNWVVELRRTGHSPRRVDASVAAGDEGNCRFPD